MVARSRMRREKTVGEYYHDYKEAYKKAYGHYPHLVRPSSRGEVKW